MTATSPSRPSALEGVRVLDLASLLAGPLIATTLGDYGADVVKVEHPRGDDARRWGKARDGIPLWWKAISRNKQLISLDLHEEADRAIVRELCLWADVVVENFRPGRLESWGLGYEELAAENPGLIMARVTGFGQTGPNAGQPGFGTLAEAFSGFAALTGEKDGPPTLPPFGLADSIAGLVGVNAVLAALHWRENGGAGQGQMIDISLYEPLFSILGPHVIENDQLGIVQTRQGNRSPRTAPRNLFETNDGNWVALSAGTQQIANRMFVAIGRPELADDERFSTPKGRHQNADAIDEIIARGVAGMSLVEALKAFQAVEAPIAPVYSTPQILDDPHYLARETVATVDDDDLGPVRMQNVVPVLSATPGSIRFTGATAIDHDRDEILERVRVARAAEGVQR
ncbi:CaiB/BaiF CoA transferase family protein [Herbiconiux sp. P17]|uniref:CaiB/BaiF CoA transferase family protein n=1 Tax=Herbiconiux wuyangfengii TaxID=3342794 RepID=UPI0035B97AEF